MKLVTRVGLLLIMCVVLLAAAAAQKGSTTDRDKCLATCKGKCTKSYDDCMKAGKNEKQCVSSRDVCNSICVNKTCPPPQTPPKK